MTLFTRRWLGRPLGAVLALTMTAAFPCLGCDGSASAAGSRGELDPAEAEQIAREQKAEAIRREVKSDFEFFVANNCPELASARERLVADIAMREERLARIEEALRSHRRSPKKDKDVRRMKRQLKEAKAMERKIEKKLGDLFIAYEKSVYANSESVRMDVLRETALANELAKASEATLDSISRERK